MPILLVTSSLDAKLTPSSMLLAWLLTGLFASLLLWRVRHLIRGDSVMGKAEATGCGVLMATFMGGTIWMVLATIPYVFDEDISWSICLTVGSLFALLGVIERPSWGRVIASGVLIMCASLDRATTGWACVVGAGLIAVWFLLGRGGQENRRWFVPMLAAGLIPLLIGSAVNYTKFGVPFGVPVTEQVWTHVNAYRRRFLASNGNSEVGTNYVLTNLLTYLRPDGLSFSTVFPFVTLPTSPPTGVNGVLFDKLYRTASVPASTPLLFILSIWGLVTAFRPRAIGRVALTRPLLLAAGGAAAALMLWGYIAPRYLGDFVPFLVLASAVALVDIFRRLEGRRRAVRLGSVGIIALVALFSITANVGMAIVPNEEFSATQVVNYVEAQKTFSDLTGHPLSSRVVRGNSLPPWGPAGQLYVIGNCDGLYISNGEDYSTVPSQQYVRTTWMTVQLGPAFQNAFRVSLPNSGTVGTESIPLVSMGRYTMELSTTPTSARSVLVRFRLVGGPSPVSGSLFELTSGATQTVGVTSDPVKHRFEISVDGSNRWAETVGSGSVHVDSPGTSSGPAPNALQVKVAQTPAPTLCESLIH
jgi:hypothetical protein